MKLQSEKANAKILKNKIFFIESHQRNNLLSQTWLAPSPRNYNTSPQGNFITPTHAWLTIIDLEEKDDIRLPAWKIYGSPLG